MKREDYIIEEKGFFGKRGKGRGEARASVDNFTGY